MAKKRNRSKGKVKPMHSWGKRKKLAPTGKGGQKKVKPENWQGS